MASFQLTNLRELSVEEQKRLCGGASGSKCEVDSCYCSCPCKCTREDPSKSVGDEFSETGSYSVMSRKEREAMSKW